MTMGLLFRILSTKLADAWAFSLSMVCIEAKRTISDLMGSGNRQMATVLLWK